MNERSLFYRYLLSAVQLVFSLVGVSVPWGHWHYTLDYCHGKDCGCILFGDRIGDVFSGGPVEYCSFVTFVQIPIFVYSVIMIFYVGYRTYVKAARVTRSIPSKINRSLVNRESQKTVTFEEYQQSLGVRITLFILSLLVTIFLLTASILTIWGFHESCSEYRRILVKDLVVSGDAADIINNRLSCSSIFDFMDYLQPNRIEPDNPYQYARQDTINTGIFLFIAQVTLLTNTFNWMDITYRNAKTLNWCRA